MALTESREAGGKRRNPFNAEGLGAPSTQRVISNNRGGSDLRDNRAVVYYDRFRVECPDRFHMGRNSLFICGALGWHESRSDNYINLLTCMKISPNVGLV